MRPSLCCLWCKTWCEVDESVRYCSACGKELGVDDFAELIRLNDEATAITKSLQSTIQRYMVMALGGIFLASIFNRWGSLGTQTIVIVVGGAALVAAGLKELSARKRLKAMYRQLQSSPNNFRPSVPKL